MIFKTIEGNMRGYSVECSTTIGKFSGSNPLIIIFFLLGRSFFQVTT